MKQLWMLTLLSVAALLFTGHSASAMDCKSGTFPTTQGCLGCPNGYAFNPAMENPFTKKSSVEPCIKRTDYKANRHSCTKRGGFGPLADFKCYKCNDKHKRDRKFLQNRKGICFTIETASFQLNGKPVTKSVREALSPCLPEVLEVSRQGFPLVYTQKQRGWSGSTCKDGAVEHHELPVQIKPKNCSVADLWEVDDWDSCSGGTDLEKKRFAAACNGHDICYRTPGQSRENCDLGFLINMRFICQKYGLKTGCLVAAEAFYKAVDIEGQDPYDKAQDNVKDLRCAPDNPPGDQ